MKKIILFVLLGVCFLLLPLSVYAGGKREKSVSLSIENKTGTQITQIITTELTSTGAEVKAPVVFNRNIENNAATTIKLKRNTLYGIVLINTAERQYAKERQAWDEETAIITFVRRDIQDRNIWDRIRRVIFWPDYL